MAIQTRLLALLENGLAQVWVQYDDVDMIARVVFWQNLLPRAVRCWVIKPDGTVLLDTTIAAGTPETSRNLTGRFRYNVDSDAEMPSVNLG